MTTEPLTSLQPPGASKPSMQWVTGPATNCLHSSFQLISGYVNFMCTNSVLDTPAIVPLFDSCESSGYAMLVRTHSTEWSLLQVCSRRKDL